MTLVIPEAPSDSAAPAAEPPQLAAQAQSTGGGTRPKACPSCGARFPADALFCSLDGSPLTSSPAVIAAAAASDPYLGREILGHIEIRQLVGIGAMGRVYRAFQRGIDRDVAVKVLHRELSSNATLVARFEREAKVASRLAHPNVVHVLLVGQLPDGAMYIVMEYLDGLSLQSALAAADGAMPLPRALHIALQLCDAAGEGHAQGIVHRDLKPENVMLVRRADDPDFVKVLDFGIARVHWNEQSMATAAGLVFGTARYISPEGAQGEQVGPPGDVYSIATMVYQMLSGRTPFNADQAVAVLVQQIHDSPPPLPSIARAAYVPEPIADVVMRNLSKKPSDRAADGRALGRAILEAAVTSGLSAQEVLARPSLLGGPRGSQPSAVQMPSMERTRQLQLDAETASRLDPPEQTKRTEPRTAYETPSPAMVEGSYGRRATNTEVVDPFLLPAGVATTKWSAPSSVHPPVGRSPSAPGVDETIDDQQCLPPRSQTLPLHSPDLTDGNARAASVSNAPTPPASALPAALRRWSRSTVAGLCAIAVALAAVATLAGSWHGGWLPGVPSFEGHAERDGALHRGAPPGPTKTAPDTTGADEPPALPPLDPSLPPRPRGAGPVSATGGSGIASAAAPVGATAAQGAGRVVLDASNAKPGIGQPVDFEARFAAGRPPKLEGPRFFIAGPGVASGTELPAGDDGSGVFRTTFTFLQNGRFEVSFSGRSTADRSTVRATRVVVVGAPGVPPLTPADEPANAAANGGANAKWL